MSDPDRLIDELRICRAALAVARQIDLQAVADGMVRAVMDYGQTSAALLYLYDDENDTFHLKSCHIAPDDPLRRGLLTLDLAEIRGHGPPSSWSPIVTRAPAALRNLSVEEVLAIPLPGTGALIGMFLLARDRQSLPLDEMDRVSRLVPELLPALVNAMVVERYRDLVIKDDQTESYNRRYFDRFLSEEVYRAHRYKTGLSLIFLDMDNLKEVNNRYGHAIGSKALREVSRRLITTIRGSDKLFRYGGDEFCIVLPETEREGARELGERLRAALGARSFLVDDTPGMALTASFGVASYPEHARTSLALVRCADRAMQKIKNSGKNSVGVSSPEEGDVPQAAGGQG
ncbi:MAG: GGDEF domain-containing protein [Acidobacteriota bacterium]